MPLSWYLILAAALFCIGLYGVLARRSAVAILMGIELMLNAVNLNLVAFWRYLTPSLIAGQAFAVIVFAVAA
ncbi:MAG: NADH-quinone oxidoreductase subunit NuoK, partial [Anaerolineales bacterium]|nr:NADH-quinone oxidoreductase subunit NuoK [Anaerolineales bacterium]